MTTPQLRPVTAAAPPPAVRLRDPHVQLTPDEALAGARAGHEAAFRDLYRFTHPGLLRYAVTLVGSDAEDVTAEAWLHVARDLHRFAGDAQAFRAWAATIVRNRAIDLMRGRARRPVVLDDLTAVEAAGPADTEGEALERLRTARAVALVASLPPDQAEAVMLRAVLGLDVAHAAAVLGKRPGAVRVAAHRGLRRLAASLGEQAHAAAPARPAAPWPAAPVVDGLDEDDDIPPRLLGFGQ